MPGNLRKNLHVHLNELHPTYVATRLQATTRSQIHHAISQANKELEQFDYYIAIVTDTGSMISAKVYGPSIDRDFSKSTRGIDEEPGYPINLQLALSDERGMTIYSGRSGGQGAQIVSSKEPAEINNAIHAELESQIKAGIDAAQTRRR